MMAYYIGAMFGAFLFIGGLSVILDRFVLKRWMDEPTLRIFVSALFAYVLVVGLAVFGNADGGPLTLSRVPLLSYFVGTGIAVAVRIRRLDARLDREEQKEAQADGIAKIFD